MKSKFKRKPAFGDVLLWLMFALFLVLVVAGMADYVTNKKGTSSYENQEWTQKRLEENEDVAASIMEKSFMNNSGLEKVKEWYDKNSENKGIYSIDHDDKTYVLMSPGTVKEQSLSFYNLKKNTKHGELVLGYSLLDNKELGIETITNTPSIVLEIEKTDLKVTMREITEE